MFERINNIKNRPLKPEPDPWVIDHNNAVDCDANNAKTNKSANITWYQGCPSADTFTLIENQNQNPPTHVMRAPKCQSIGNIAGAADDGVE